MTLASQTPRALSRRTVLTGVTGLGAALALAACSGGSQGGAASSDTKALTVVTSTEVYADIVRAIGGSAVSVQAIIPATQDPHSYEAAARDKLTVQKADVVVVNGGGFDQFLTDLAQDTGKKDALVDAVAVSALPGADEAVEDAAGGHDHAGHDHSHGAFNEHVWYSVSAMRHLADALLSALTKAAPEAKDQITSGHKSFTAALDSLTKRIAELQPTAKGASYLATEPVPGYLFSDLGLEDATPEALLSAIEEETDIPAAVLQNAKTMLTQKKVKLLAYNTQTASPQTDLLVSTAKSAGVPVVSLAESMPAGTSYIDWMNSNLDGVKKALAA